MLLLRVLCEALCSQFLAHQLWEHARWGAALPNRCAEDSHTRAGYVRLPCPQLSPQCPAPAILWRCRQCWLSHTAQHTGSASFVTQQSHMYSGGSHTQNSQAAALFSIHSTNPLFWMLAQPTCRDSMRPAACPRLCLSSAVGIQALVAAPHSTAKLLLPQLPLPALWLGCWLSSPAETR